MANVREGQTVRWVVGVVVLVGGVIAVAVDQHNAAEQLRAVAPLVRSELAAPSVLALERSRGFSSIDERTLVAPQVAAPLRHHGDTWAAHAVDRTAESAPTPTDARGVVVSVDHDGVTLDPLTGWLPSDRVPDAPGRVAWIAFVRRSTVHARYHLHGRAIDADRIDVRLARVADGALLGRVSAQAAEPSVTERDVPDRLGVDSGVIAHELVELLDDASTAAPAASTPFPNECLTTAPLDGAIEDVYADACMDGATPRCRSDCEHGVAGACLRTALGLEHDASADTNAVYRRACELGAPAACSRYARSWLRTSPSDSTCARELLERACAAGDSTACP